MPTSLHKATIRTASAGNDGRWFLQSPGASNFALGWQENYQFAPWKFVGSHQFTVGLSYEHSHYDGRQTFWPVALDGVSDLPVERITFTSPSSFAVAENEMAWFAGDQWSIVPRLTLSLGVRFDHERSPVRPMPLLARDFSWPSRGMERRY